MARSIRLGSALGLAVRSCRALGLALKLRAASRSAACFRHHPLDGGASPACPPLTQLAAVRPPYLPSAPGGKRDARSEEIRRFVLGCVWLYRHSEMSRNAVTFERARVLDDESGSRRTDPGLLRSRIRLRCMRPLGIEHIAAVVRLRFWIIADDAALAGKVDSAASAALCWCAT